jgi:20S proteasome subunit alpha 5
LTLQEAISLALKVLKAVMEEKLSSSNIQVATVTPEKGYKIVSEEDLAPLVAALH